MTGDRPAGHGAYPALDGLRAVAVLAVVTTHSAFQTGRYTHGFGNNLMARMDSGVAVFFVLSGFLLVRPWLATAALGRPLPSTRTYARRRVARIMPAYTVAIVLCFLLLSGNDGVNGWDWLRHLTLIQTYHVGWLRPGLTQTWSLCVEALFYVLLPLVGLGLVRLCRRQWRPGLLLAVLGLGMLVPLPWYVVAHASPAPWLASSGLWLPGFTGWFAGGMALAVVRTHLDSGMAATGSRWWVAEELGRHPFTCWALAAFVYFAAMTPIAGPRSIQATTAAQSVTKQTLYLVVALALTWPAVFGRSEATRAILGNRVMRYLGDISYGVFLYHLLVLHGVMRLLGYPLWSGRVVQVLPLTAVGAGLLAAVSFRYLERPVIAWAHSGSAASLVPTRRRSRHAAVGRGRRDTEAFGETNRAATGGRS